MNSNLKIILDLQDMEIELKSLQAQIDRQTASLLKVKRDRALLKSDYKKSEDRFELLVAERRQNERHLADFEAKKANFIEHQKQVITVKESEILLQQIATTENSIGDLEELILGQLEREESQSKDLAMLKEKSSALYAEKGSEGKHLEGLIKEREGLKFDLEQERVAGLNRLSSDLKNHYDWLYNKFGSGSAVARMEGGACTGCGTMLLHKTIQGLKSANEISQCDHCMRFLWVDA